MTADDARPAEYYRPGPPAVADDGTLVLTRHADVLAGVEAERRGDLSGSRETIAAALTAAGFPASGDDLHLLFSFAWARDPGQDPYTAMMAAMHPYLYAHAAQARRDARAAGEELAAAAAAGGRVDVVAFSRALATAVTARLTGMTAGDAAPLTAEAGAASRRGGLAVFAREPGAVTEHLRAWVAARQPAGQLADAAIAAFSDGRLSERDMHAVLFGFWAAGWETTAAAAAMSFLYLAGSGWLARPELLLPALRNWRRAVTEETLRLSAPFSQHTMIACRPAELCGVRVEPGQRVALRWAAANRDPAVFTGPDPGEFHPGRPGVRKHLAFGAGWHACAGAALARETMDAGLETLVPLLSGAELTGVQMVTGMVDGPAMAMFLLSGGWPRRRAARTAAGTA
jgi:cytochrome P450